MAKVGFVAQDTPTYARAEHRRAPALRRAAEPGLGRRPGARPDRPARPRRRAAGAQALRRPARAARAHARRRQAPRAADPRRAGRQPRPARPARVPAGPDGGRRRARAERRAVLAPGLRPRAGVRLPGRARRLARAARGRPRHAAGDPPPADRPAPRRGHAARRPARHRREPHRPPEHATSCAPTRRSTTPPGRSRSSRLEDLVLAYMGRHRAEAAAARAGGRSDDLAHLAPVARPGRVVSTARSRRCSLFLAISAAPSCRRSTSTLLRAAQCRAASRTRSSCSRSFAVLFVPAHRRRLLGRAAGRPRARGRHAPARVEPVRHAHALAGDQARRHRRWPRWSRSACSSLRPDLVVRLAGQRDQRRADDGRDRSASRRIAPPMFERARDRADRLHALRARRSASPPGSWCAASCPRWRSRSRSSSPCRSLMPMFVREHLGPTSRPTTITPDNDDRPDGRGSARTACPQGRCSDLRVASTSPARG